jgi:hypothetical protein
MSIYSKNVIFTLNIVFILLFLMHTTLLVKLEMCRTALMRKKIKPYQSVVHFLCENKSFEYKGILANQV